ncbi:putative RNA polymerase sigma-70 factor [Vibrio nigripulchritudo SO65]|uniref:RNA polymerase sigma factor n=1 Tax=Vibrio nigripulchritudo TaxID=28173 RepID=UPI0003B19F79|nr:DUF6596 domain-containing protein [Vibrio nigripulchritudo]CCN36899.1 putative RNA polymerase sigma-70 factor [Vibrio nigripulchritudo AM115]CCN41130.1 putative RNA polymerase sigma-70 factor [Vibrio nigripulchritudo FTn2]CCN76304.1 putative RNA polymerase sigma-70 factor [Vibrio nigripulchritudo SO65]
MSEEYRAAEMAARSSYGKLLAYLSSRTHDIALAEDALAEAFTKALSHWKENGIPNNPEAWLMTVAKNKITDRQRQLVRFPEEPEIEEEANMESDSPALPDKRLELMMVCAHPAISADLHTPLMLQTVLGIEAKVIARLFMYPPAALAKRLVRAKAKVRDSGIPFQVPDPSQLPSRCQTIYEAIYALHTYDWLDPNDTLGEEALYLADLLVSLVPDDPEAKGLAALIAFGHARRLARIHEQTLVPVEKQDMTLWDDSLSLYAQRKLKDAHALNRVGRFQIEAAIQSVHQARKSSGITDWEALSKLYPALIQFAPSVGAKVAYSVVVAKHFGYEKGLNLVLDLESEIGSGFQPLWATKAEFYRKLCQPKEAADCYQKAISLSTDTPTIRFLENQLNSMRLN